MLNNKDTIIKKIEKIFRLISKSTLKDDFNLIDSVKYFFSQDQLVKEKPKYYKEFIIALIEYRRLTKDSDNKNSQESNNEIISDSNRDNTYADIVKHLNQNWVSNNPQLYKEIVFAVVKQDGLSLEFASDELRNDKDIVLAAMSENKNALTYCLFVKYNEILKAAINKYGIDILTYVNKDWALANPEPYYQIVERRLLQIRFICKV